MNLIKFYWNFFDLILHKNILVIWKLKFCVIFKIMSLYVFW